MQQRASPMPVCTQRDGLYLTDSYAPLPCYSQLAPGDPRDVALAVRAVVVMDPATAAGSAARGVVEDPILLASLLTETAQPEEGVAMWTLRLIALLLVPAAAALWHLFVRVHSRGGTGPSLRWGALH